jgi:lycopene beta-cyclase
MQHHLILVGGGLANGLLAYRLQQLRPDVAVTVVERAGELGGNHTWSYHASDLDESARDWVAPFTVRSWPFQSVFFRNHARRLDTPYCTVSSERLRALVMDALDGAPLGQVRLGAAVSEIGPTHVTLASGETIDGTAVIDGRGFPAEHGLRLGWQKFHGIEVRTREPHGLEAPILMDARVPQIDGFRFIYTLPLSADRLLIEDTRYSDTPVLDVEACGVLLHSYASAHGWIIARTERTETGALPVALGGQPAAFFSGRGDVALSGLAAGMFHPTTGYSLPDAVRMADFVAAQRDLSPHGLAGAMRAQAKAAWRRRGYFRMLNRMLFQAALPAERHRIFDRFYTLDARLIERFYADRLTLGDKLRILTGRPPVPIGRAIGAIMSAVRPIGQVQEAFRR